MQKPTPPNVLLVCTDHWPAALLGCAGHPAIRTPTLDQIAANGTRFTNIYSECPVCVPARRTLMTGLSPESHGMNVNANRPMPQAPTLAECFNRNGYHSVAVGKLHVSPQRQRLGFDEVILDEEGRGPEGCRNDDYELYLREQGHAGQRFVGGMNNNEYHWRPWHLDERHHVTNWASREMCRQILRRDPTRPGFWYLSFCHPHPPLVPLQAYLDLYRDVQPPAPAEGSWAAEAAAAPAIRQLHRETLENCRDVPVAQIAGIRRAFYALATHIDHQLRLVIGTLREEGLLANTILCFTSDHGDMLGDHGLWAKRKMYEGSANVPLLVAGTRPQAEADIVPHHQTDPRPGGLRDLMPTLLSLAGLPVPEHCEGVNLFTTPQRTVTTAGHGELKGGTTGNPSRMVCDGRLKLIYYPLGNLVQLFDLENDPTETHDLAGRPEYAAHENELREKLIEQMPAPEREAWTHNGSLQGFPAPDPGMLWPNFNFSGQRGYRWME